MTQTGSRMGQLSKSGSARAAGRTELGFPLLLSPGAQSLFGLFRSHGLAVSRTFPVLTLCRRMWYRDLQYAFSKSAADLLPRKIGYDVYQSYYSYTLCEPIS